MTTILDEIHERMLSRAYEEIFADASTVTQVKSAILRIIGNGGVPAVLLLKDIGDRLGETADGNRVQ